MTLLVVLVVAIAVHRESVVVRGAASGAVRAAEEVVSGLCEAVAKLRQACREWAGREPLAGAAELIATGVAAVGLGVSVVAGFQLLLATLCVFISLEGGHRAWAAALTVAPVLAGLGIKIAPPRSSARSAVVLFWLATLSVHGGIAWARDVAQQQLQWPAMAPSFDAVFQLDRQRAVTQVLVSLLPPIVDSVAATIIIHAGAGTIIRALLLAPLWLADVLLQSLKRLSGRDRLGALFTSLAAMMIAISDAIALPVESLLGALRETAAWLGAWLHRFASSGLAAELERREAKHHRRLQSMRHASEVDILGAALEEAKRLAGDQRGQARALHKTVTDAVHHGLSQTYGEAANEVTDRARTAIAEALKSGELASTLAGLVVAPWSAATDVLAWTWRRRLDHAPSVDPRRGQTNGHVSSVLPVVEGDG